jgi:hypothetical protein
MLPSSHQYDFRMRLSNITVPKLQEEKNMIHRFSLFALDIADCSLKILHYLISFISEAQNSNNIFFTNSIDLSHIIDDTKEYIEYGMDKIHKKFDHTNQSHTARPEKFFERRNVWILVLTTMDEIEDKIEKLHEFYYQYYGKTIRTLLEKVDT